MRMFFLFFKSTSFIIFCVQVQLQKSSSNGYNFSISGADRELNGLRQGIDDGTVSVHAASDAPLNSCHKKFATSMVPPVLLCFIGSKELIEK